MSKIFTKGFYIAALLILFTGITLPVLAQVTSTNLETGRLYSAMAKDASGNLYITRASTGGATYEVAKYTNGTGTPVVIYSGLTHQMSEYPWGLAVDGSGNVYLSTDFTTNSGAIIKLTYGGGTTYTPSTFVTGKYYTALAFDVSNNLYTTQYVSPVTQGTDGTYAVFKYPAGSTTGAQLYNGLKSSAGYSYPTGLAVAANGDIYVTDAFTTDPTLTPDGGRVLKLSAASSYSATTVSTGHYAAALALDATGNLYTTENMSTNSNSGYMLYKYTGNAVTAVYSPLHTNGIFYPWGIAVLSAQNIDVIDGDDGTTGGAVIQLNLPVPVAAPNITYATAKIYATGITITPLTPANSGGAVPATVYGQVSTFAGSGAHGFANGTGTAASFYFPNDVATDFQGNVYVADRNNNVIRKITPSGVVSTFAGSGAQGSADGFGTAATFFYPNGVATDALGNVFVADYYNNLIRKITPGGVVTTLAGSGAQGSNNGTGAAASFYYPYDVTTDAQGNVYVAEFNNFLIRKITPGGVVSTFAGSGAHGSANGTGTAASFNGLKCIATDAQGNIYVSDSANQLIRKISPAGVVTTYAGSGAMGAANGAAASASFQFPTGVATDALGNIYVGDNDNELIRKITPAGVVSTLAGSGASGSANGIGTAASFQSPSGLATDAQGNLYVADFVNYLIRKIIITGYTITPSLPAGLTFDATTGTISGTPTVGSPATNYTITAYNTGGSSSSVVNITVNMTYYSKASGSLSSLATYGTSPDGTGTAPTDFNGSGMGTSTVYQLANRGSYALTANLSVGTTLNIPSGASLDISSYALTLNNLAGAGTLSGSAASALTVNGTGVNLAFNTNANQLGSLTLGSNASVTLTSALSIAGTGTLNLPANGTLNTGGFLTLKSGTAGTAAVTALGSGSSVNGDVVAERYVSDKRAWRLISPPVNSYLTINGNWQEGAGGTLNNPSPGFGTFVIGSSLSNGFDVNSTSTSSLMVYTGGALSGIANTNYTALNAYAGYFMFIIGNRGLNPASTQVHSSTVLRSTGALRTGAQTVNLGGTALTLAGNPYASPVDFANVTRSTGVANQFYAWDYNLNTYGGYVLVTNIAGNYTSVPASPSGLNNILQSGQAFFVYNNSPNGGILTFNESSKATGNGLGTFGAPVAGGSSNNNNSLRINLLAAAASGTPNAVIDGVMAGYGPAYSNQVDADDAVKMTNLYENIALQRDKQLLTLERRQDITVKDTLFIQLSGMKAQGYQLQVDPAAFSAPVGTTAYLEDAYLHTRTKLDLTQLTVGAFNIVAGSAASYQDRFMITFANDSQPLAVATATTGNKVAIYPNPIDQKRVSMYFNAVPVGIYTVTLVNAMGQVMQKKDIAYNGNNYNQLMDAAYSSGVYIINIRSAGFNQTGKIIIP